jgi:3-oxoacyl-[acyl-carrier protein] reductase
VTGASRGIGRAVAERLAADGRLVVLVSRSVDALEGVCRQIEDAGGAAEVRPCDIGDGEALSGLIEATASTHGRLDILVNNAGVTRDSLMLRMSHDDFDEVIHVNLRAAFIACRAAARPMMRNRFGRIVNIGSITGVIGNVGQVNYAAAKAGLIGLTKTTAKELGAKGITANMVAPGFVETEMLDQIPQQRKDAVIKALPLRRFGRPEEIAHAVSFVASDQAGYMTGQVLVIDGGLAG